MSEDETRPDTTLVGDPSLTRRPAAARAAPQDASPRAPSLPGARYVGFRHLARGGQGDVFSAFDQRLARPVALKVLRPDRLDTAHAIRHEVGLMVGLQHPGIVPVYDRGETEDGRPWFAMELLDGATLGRVIDRMRAGDAEWTPRRVLDLLARIAAAVGFAHQQGIVHCDLKPANVIVGAFGEARIMDWGIARRAEPPTDPLGQVAPGAPAGTPGHIAPERFEGAPPAPPVDVYSLGAILYRVLTGRRPGPVIGPPEQWAATWPDGSTVAAELLGLCAAACAPDPAGRPADGAALARRLIDWLDGARRRDEARALLAEADAMRRRWRAMRDEIEALRHQGAQALAEVGPRASAAAKRPGRALQDAAEARATEADLLELRLIGAVQAALTREPALPGARRLLAAHYRDVLLDAEAARDPVGVRRAAAQVRQYGDAAQVQWLDGPGALSLTCDRPDARITLCPYVEVDRRLVAAPGQVFGHTLRAEPVQPGSYLALIEAPGHAPTRCPIRLERGVHWQNAPPGEGPAAVRLLPLEALESDACHVPGGWCVVGGDRAAIDPLPRRSIWVDGFAIDRTSVTHRAWRDFLADVATQRGVGALSGLLPQPRDARGDARGPIVIRPDGALVFGRDEDGEPIDPESPVSLIDLHAAEAYARWRAARTGRPWRLPHDIEWEKAARGVDGRLWPWGDAFDPTLTRVLESFEGAPRAGPVGAVSGDESPYGVRDMAGLIRNWCASDYQREGPEGDRLRRAPPSGPLRMVRGGVWVAAAQNCRPAGRFANRPTQRFRTIGVRLARSIGPER